jgi:hypothetical protein
MRRKRRKFRHQVIKASGLSEPYDPHKLENSLRRSGATPSAIREVMCAVEDQISEGMTTRALYRLAHDELKRAERPAAARYSLRRATLALGPSGYPFERLIAALLATQGYTTVVGTIVRGRCVSHEVDVIAARKGDRIYAECKFHSQLGFRTDVKVTLYVHARAMDLSAVAENGVSEFWLATNAKFTSDAIQYGTCSDLHLLGWDHPKGRGLEWRLEHSQIMPLTCLTTLRGFAKKRLLEGGVVTTEEIASRPELLGEIGLHDGEVHRVLREIQQVADLVNANSNGVSGTRVILAHR